MRLGAGTETVEGRRIHTSSSVSGKTFFLAKTVTLETGYFITQVEDAGEKLRDMYRLLVPHRGKWGSEAVKPGLPGFLQQG